MIVDEQTGIHYDDGNEPVDKVVQSVLEAYKRRSKAGIDKYGTTLDREDLNTLDWLQHLQEELMDATLYVEKLKRMYRLIATGTMESLIDEYKNKV